MSNSKTTLKQCHNFLSEDRGKDQLATLAILSLAVTTLIEDFLPELKKNVRSAKPRTARKSH